jgi:hypothetical protein
MFSAITRNLQKAYRPSVSSPNSLADLQFPDFNQLNLPDVFTAEERKKLLDQITVQVAASFAARLHTPTVPKISFKDYETQHANDTKPIETPIKDDADSFISGLFQFRHAREQFRGWEIAMFISQYQATSNNNGTEADNDTSDANKWHVSKIDLFKDFKKIDIDDLKAWANRLEHSQCDT